MSYLQALILSIVEGITEFLPISSIGHLILTSKILSILLAIPTMFAATGLDLFKSVSNFNGSQLSILFFGSATSFIFAYLAIKWLLNFIKHRNFTIFGIYRILLALLFLVLARQSF